MNTYEKLRISVEKTDPKGFFKAYELILTDEEGEIKVCKDSVELTRRSNGNNDRGMIAWEMEIWAPDAPRGRKIVVISNDITYQMGSFSMREHRLYHKVKFLNIL